MKVNENEATSEEIAETLPSTDEAPDDESQAEQLNNFEDDVTENQSASTIESHPDAQLASPSAHAMEHESPDVNKRLVEATKEAVTNSVDSPANGVISEGNETKDTPEELIKETSANMNVASDIEPGNDSDIFVNETDISENKMEVTEVASASSSEHAQISDFKTTLGTTFDAVASDDEVTRSVTPYEEEESEPLDDPSVGEEDNVVGTPLLTFSEDVASDKVVKDKSLPDTSDDRQEGEKEKNMWTSLGDAVFSVVTGGERTASDISSDEDDEDDDDEEEEQHEASNRQKRSYGAEEVDDPALPEPEEEPEHTESVIEQPLFKSVQQDDKDPHMKSDTLPVDGADGRDKEVIVDEEALDETAKPTETSASSVPPPSDLGSPAAPLTEQMDLREAEEAVQHKEEPIDSGSSADRVAIRDGVVPLENRDVDRDLAQNQIVDSPELSSSEAHEEESTGKMHLENLEVKDVEIVRGKIPNQVLDSVAEFESNTSHTAEFSVEEPVTHVVLAQDELEVEKGAHIEQEEKEELMEDENALYLTQSNETNSEDTGPETASASVSPPEPLYSDSVLRLTLLRDHLSEKRMEQVQKLLGLMNLFKVEAMFSDLEVELQATRRSHTGSSPDVERALEGILEASETTILDEIEKMLDSQAKYEDGQSPDESSSDLETEILDDFQELAFSLRQKYSTASDSAPLTAEEQTDIEPGGFVLGSVLLSARVIVVKCGETTLSEMSN